MKLLFRLKIPFIIFLVFYFLFLVLANVPAGWGLWFASKAVPGLWMDAPKGTLWKGQASSGQVVFDRTQAPIALGTVQWRLSPLSVVRLKPCIELTSSVPQQYLSVEVCQGVGGVSQVKNLTFDAPISTLQAYMPVELAGDLSVQIIEATIHASGEIKSLNARYSWQRARAQFDGNWFGFGSIAGTAKENGSGGALTELFELDGPYKFALNGEWTDLKAGWKVQGTVTPQANADKLVVQGLQLLGEDLGDGSYKVQWP